jgi:hypothetical protein
MQITPAHKLKSKKVKRIHIDIRIIIMNEKKNKLCYTFKYFHQKLNKKIYLNCFYCQVTVKFFYIYKLYTQDNDYLNIYNKLSNLKDRSRNIIKTQGVL